ncbi:MAG TPA: vanadium-dependent haloperoxidase [Candidatus Eisenbacteria bacterium]
MTRSTTLPALAAAFLLLAGCGTEAPDQPIAATGDYQPIVLGSTVDPSLPAPGNEAAAVDPDDPVLAAAPASFGLTPAAAGNPVVYWNEYVKTIGTAASLPPPALSRAYSLVMVGIYDALVAGNDSRRGGKLSANAAAAGAACEVLVYLFPGKAEQIQSDAALEAGISRGNGAALGGWNMGRAVGRQIVKFGKADGSSEVFAGTIPTGPGIWTGTNPVLPLAGHWTCWVLDGGDEIAPPPPFAYGSPEDLLELQAVIDAAANRTPGQIEAVHKWGDRSPPAIWNTSYINPRLLASGFDPVESARISAFANIAMTDAFINCWACKYHFWTARPSQRIAGLVTVIPTPNFPSYTSGHSTISASVAEVLADVWPDEASYFRAEANEAAMSRLWGGIHFPQDNSVGATIGREVGIRVVERMHEKAPIHAAPVLAMR